jgi:GT2 family glycosyltransferase
MAGYKVIFQPSAVIFHDKRLSVDGKWVVGAAEEYYSAEAALMMAHKWSRPGLVKLIEMYLSTGGSERQRAALKAFREKRDRNELPQPIDAEHKIGQFIDGNYARHRF